MMITADVVRRRFASVAADSVKDHDFCRAMLCIRTAYAVMRCLSVRLSHRSSVTFMYCVKMRNRILKCFSLSVASSFEFFRTKPYCNIPI